MGRKEGFVDQMNQNQMDLQSSTRCSNCLNFKVVLKPIKATTEKCTSTNKNPTNLHKLKMGASMLHTDPTTLVDYVPVRQVEDTIS